LHRTLGGDVDEVKLWELPGSGPDT